MDDMWPSPDVCECAVTDEERARFLILAETTALRVVTDAAGENVCAALLPHFLGMVTAFAMGYCGKMLEERRLGLPLLQYPQVDSGCRIACRTMQVMIEESSKEIGRC